MGREGGPSEKDMGLRPEATQVAGDAELMKGGGKKIEDEKFRNIPRTIYRIRPQSGGLGVHGNKEDAWIIERSFGTSTEGLHDRDTEGKKLPWSKMDVAKDKDTARKRAETLMEGRDAILVEG